MSTTVPQPRSLLSNPSWQRLADSWSTFWFAPCDLRQVSLFRCLFGMIATGMYAYRQFAVGILFTDSGLVSTDQVYRLLPEFYQPMWLWFPRSLHSIQLLHGFFVFLLILFTLGIIGRNLTWLIYFLHLCFVQRNMGAVYGADYIVTFWLFYLSFMRHNVHFSVLNYFFPARRQTMQGDWLTSLGRRLIQIQLCIIYTYSGLEKLKGELWWEGTALWNIFINPQLTLMDFSFMKNYPSLVSLMSYYTILFETYFAVLVWIRPLTPWILAGGLALHTGILLVMGLLAFGSVMCVPYVLFLPPRWLRLEAFERREKR